MLKKGDSKLINAWAFYDWANSVYSLVISTAVFPIYYSSLTETFVDNEGKIGFLGMQWYPTTLYDYTLSFAFLIVAIMSPILSGIADYTGNKLVFLKRLCLLGAVSVMCLFFFKDEQTLWIGIVFTVLASIGFWGSLVFYNAYLPEVAYPEQQDKVSAKGFMYGYVGSVILLSFCLVMIQKYELFGLSGAGMATRVTFILVGLWWLGFAQVTYRRLPNNIFNKKAEDKHYFWKGIKELKIVWNQLKELPKLRYYLYTFFLFSVGVQTIILMAGIFGSKELQLESSSLILLIMIVQLVAILGAYLFSIISNKLGNFKALQITIITWGIVCFIAFSLNKSTPNVLYYFYGLGALIGLVMGAIQSLSRSTYSKLLPETEDHATFFSFYDVTEKIAIVIGMFFFGLLNAIFGSMQYSVLFLASFFVVSSFLLVITQKKSNFAPNKNKQ
ncbi:MAG: MFS transporter [Flavobacteriaceae bacterium]|nr:MFS transporter [Flavobacteriaceae bacterium]